MRQSPGTNRRAAGWMRFCTLIVSAVFTAVGILMIVSGESFGWLIACFFGLCLLIEGANRGCSFPTEAAGMDRVWDELKARFPGFDYQPLIHGGTDDAKHLCWERQVPTVG